MNTFTKKSKTLILLLFVMVAMLAMPITAMAAPEDNITVEWRYTPGNEYTIPQTYTFAGRTFVLLSQAAPVLESTLPATRTYNYRIMGDLTEADMLLIDDSAKVNFTPKTISRDREVERTLPIAGLTTNDVEELGNGIYKEASGTGLYKEYKPDPLFDPGVTKRDPLKVSSVKYTVESYETIGGTGKLPKTYSAEVLLKGLEWYDATEYYTVDATYSTSKTEGEVDQYVIVATYEPTDLATGTAPVAPGTTDTPAAPTEIADTQTPLADAQSGNSIPQNIADGNVPLSSGNSTENSWSLLSLILSVVAVCVGVFSAIQIYLNRRSAAEIADGKKKPTIALNIAACAIGIATIFIWLFMDAVSLSNSYVWINNFTPIVGLLLALTIILFVGASARNRNSNRTADEASA